MKTETKVIDGRELKPHDGVTEWSVCGRCGVRIDWANDVMTAGRDRTDTSCPHCGHSDTAYLYTTQE